jgi:ABC-type multidrug transport system fused ATPase/permease subunit
LGIAIAGEPRIFAVSVAASAVYGMMTVAAAQVLGEVVSRLILPALSSGHTTTGALVAASTAILAVAVLKALGIVGRRLYAGVMQYRLQATYRRRVTRQYLRLPLAWHHQHPTGQLLSNANADVEAAWYPIAPLPMAVGVLVMLVFAAVAMLLADPVLAIVGYLLFPAIAALNVAYRHGAAPRVTRAQRLRAEVSEVAHESFDGALVVKTLGRQREETERFTAKAHELRDANIAVGRIRGLFDPALEALPNLGVLVVLLVGSARIAAGATTPGVVVQVAYLFTLLAFPVRAIGWVLGELPRSVVGYDRVSAVLTASGALEYGDRKPVGSGGAGLRARSVRFGYVPGHDVLRDVSFDVDPGRVLAVVGATGSGKSTLTTLLVRLVDPAAGEVLLDGVDLRELRRGGVAASTALVGQQAFLFDETVRGNVTLGRPDLDDDTVWWALRLAQADRFVAALPDGLDTRIGERGATLSGGQRQRLALARALAGRPRLLVLDDATSAVDPRVEAAILTGLRDARLAATVIVVAYRKATIALADEIVYLEGGQVAARGEHGWLLEHAPGYRALLTAYERAAKDAAAERESEAADDADEAVA